MSHRDRIQELEAQIAAPQVTAPYLFNMGDAREWAGPCRCVDM